MTEEEFVALIDWLGRFFTNLNPFTEITPADYKTIICHYNAGIDPWKSSSAIEEGRDIDDLT